MNTIGKMLRNARLKQEMTQAELAKKVGVCSGLISHLENDSHIHLSEKLALKLIAKAKAPIYILVLRKSHNERSRDWYHRFFSRAKRNKKAA